jgi:sugar O-acyltransferase (sialic acid O-acetyltransferase NeuD family)
LAKESYICRKIFAQDIAIIDAAKFSPGYFHSHVNDLLMKKIYIFGAGGFAKEVYFLLTEINREKAAYEFAGFIDVAPKINQLRIGKKEFEIFDEAVFFKKEVAANSCFAIGIGSPKTIRKIRDKYFSDFDFPNLIHPRTIGDFDSIEKGEGNIITAGCIFTIDTKIGSFNIFNLNCTIGHDSVIGSCNVISPGTNLSGKLNMGDGNLLGTNSTVLENLNIHDNAVIGAGTVVRNDVESKQTIIGNPGVDVVKFGKLRNFINKL